MHPKNKQLELKLIVSGGTRLLHLVISSFETRLELPSDMCVCGVGEAAG